jgi:hypothetical protein
MVIRNCTYHAFRFHKLFNETVKNDMKESSNFFVQTSVSLDRSLRPMDRLPIFTKRFAEMTYQVQVYEKLLSHCGQYDSSLLECDAI